MLKRMMGFAIVLLAAGCSSAPAPEEPPQWSAIKFVPQESQQSQESAEGRDAKRSISR
jgi:hypothetical protein